MNNSKSACIIDNIKYLLIESEDVKNIILEPLLQLLSAVDEFDGIILPTETTIDEIKEVVKRYNISANTLGFKCHSLSNAMYILDCIMLGASKTEKCHVLVGISALSQMIVDNDVLVMRMKWNGL